MDNETSCTVYEDIVVPESALLRRNMGNRYGSVSGLDDSELADPDELERQVLIQEFGPVLALPVKTSKSGVRPEVDENGNLDWGAFGSVDFDRYSGGVDKARFKADILREQRKDLLVRFGMVGERIKAEGKRLVLKYLEMDIIGFEHIINDDMRILARLYLRARRLEREIAELGQASERRSQQRAAALWGTW
ncbi:MAG: hypothetical protein ACYS14_08825 [Planctomycetota bacterium]|jgi:hypothetical protein